MQFSSSNSQYIIHQSKQLKTTPLTWIPCSKFGFDVSNPKAPYPLLSLQQWLPLPIFSTVHANVPELLCSNSRTTIPGLSL